MCAAAKAFVTSGTGFLRRIPLTERSIQVEQKKMDYVKPELLKHELLRDVTAIQLSRVVGQQPV